MRAQAEIVIDWLIDGWISSPLAGIVNFLYWGNKMLSLKHFLEIPNPNSSFLGFENVFFASLFVCHAYGTRRFIKGRPNLDVLCCGFESFQCGNTRCVPFREALYAGQSRPTSCSDGATSRQNIHYSTRAAPLANFVKLVMSTRAGMAGKWAIKSAHIT